MWAIWMRGCCAYTLLLYYRCTTLRTARFRVELCKHGSLLRIGVINWVMYGDVLVFVGQRAEFFAAELTREALDFLMHDLAM
mmetsp:Transcript_13262/g.28791  ORF Transcript_13262/g.28791 Transcript_13262/m.28791 type:complete len:82 (+) Transcript_13262:2-247(+)